MANGSRRLRLLIATSNRGKAREIEGILAESFPGIFEIEIGDNIKKIEIQSEDLAEIALTALKSVLKAIDRGRWDSVIVEDSGLFIEALKGFPGPYSSYVLKKIGLEGVLRLMEDKTNRRACYRAAVAYTINGEIRVAGGEVCGSIAQKPAGIEGFGYDPIFIPEGYRETFAQLGESVKNRISHRAIAIRRAVEEILSSAGRRYTA